jgi:hypothetical protein
MFFYEKFLSYKIVTYTKRKQISFVSSFIIAKNVRLHFASLKMHRMHAHCKSLQKWVPHAHRNLLPHIAHPQVAATHCKSCFENLVPPALYIF